MNSNRKLSCAIAAILGAQAVAVTYTARAADAEPDRASKGELQEITVTAQRRSENAQNVPITLQALTAETLTQLNATTFEDYVKFLPNVTVSTQGPGLGQIYMRGLATTQDGVQSSGATGSFPNVAVYLDEQSAQLPGRNLDIYAADIERVEVLEGPQGTLFGAGAQAGVIRYITNKPKLNVTEGNVNAGYATTAHGEQSSNVDATLNLPLIADTLAMRAVIYNENRGGYIDNVPGNFTRKGTDRGIVDYFGGVVPPGSAPITNEKISGKDINPVTYKGFRLSGLYQFNQDWSALVTQSYQSMEADGVFAQMPNGPDGEKLPDLSVVQFNPSYDKDRFSNTSWTVNGRIGMLKAVYTGGYLLRHVEQVADYTNYSRGVYADYYQCILPGSPFAPDPITGKNAPTTNSPGTCFSPSATFKVQQKNTHQNHEFRLSTPDDLRIRAIGGLFWEDFKVHDQSDWFYKDISAGFNPLSPPPGATMNNPNVRPATESFYDDITRGYKQKAVFGSVDFEIIPKTLTLTAGTRYYQMDTFQVGAAAGSFGCRSGGIYSAVVAPNPCVTGTSLDTIVVPPGNEAFSDSAVGLKKRYSGFKSRVNLSWKIDSDRMVYATWSQGFRPGGFNRASGFVAPATSPLAGSFLTPIGFKPDTLVNKEIGWKTQWFDHRLQFNGAVYQEDWKDTQIGLFNPGLLGNLTFTTNGPDYRVRGVETDIIARVTEGLTVSGGASWNSSELHKTVTLKDKNGVPIDFQVLGLSNPFGTEGDPLAQSPPFQANLRARYEFKFSDYDAFVQLAGTHRAHSVSTTDRLTRDLQGNPTAYDQPAFSTMDGSIGVAKDAWNVQLYGTNLTDERANLYSSYSQWIRMDTVNRPRTLGVKFGYKFGGQ